MLFYGPIHRPLSLLSACVMESLLPLLSSILAVVFNVLMLMLFVQIVSLT